MTLDDRRHRRWHPKLPILVKKWLKENGLSNLEVTNVKDFRMIKLYDDRAVSIEKNTGRILS